MLTLSAAWALAGAPARAQDSVAATPGGNDALLPWLPAAQRVRYIVDLAPVATSWGARIAVGPVLKASATLDAPFRTQILGASALSADAIGPVSFTPAPFAHWTAAGAGVNAGANTAPGAINADSFDQRFTLATNGLSTSATEIIGALIGRNDADLSRLYIERVAALCSRPTPVAPDAATIALGAADAAGGVHIRADAFNGGAIAGQNILRVDIDQRGGAVNALAPAGAVNSASDSGATSFLLNGAGPTVATPAGMAQLSPAPARHSLALNFAEMFIAGRNQASAYSAASHVVAALEPRGSPTYTIAAPAGGDGGAVALLARTGPMNGADALASFGLALQNDLSGPRVAAGSRRSAVLPSPITGPGGFTANAAPGDARFDRHLNQTLFRGGSGHVGAGRDAQGRLILAAAASDANAGDFIAVARFSAQTAAWSVAAHAGMAVLDGPNGAPIGSLTPAPPAWLSSPAVDLLGNVYFTARWTPTAGPGAGSVQTGLFRAVNTVRGYEIERLLTTGQTILGPNSASFYVIAGLALADADSVASGASHGGSILQRPARPTTDPASVFAFGGLVVNATIDYLRPGGATERYEAAMFVGPRASPCPGDVNGDGFVDFADANIIISQFNTSGSGLEGDANGDGDVNFADLNLVVSAFNTAC